MKALQAQRIGAATELDELERWSEVVPDVVLSTALQNVEAPKAATSSRSVLAGIMANPASFARYRAAVEQARAYDRCAAVGGAAAKTACYIDKALANVGAVMLENVSGAVSTELDPRDAHDASALVARGRQVAGFYKDLGVPSERVLVRMPATWAAVTAARALEAEGISCHLVLVYAFSQAVAAAAAGVKVVQPNVGRLADYYDKNPGLIRDPNAVVKEAMAIARAGYGEKASNPGILLVEKIWAHCRRAAPSTSVMASGLRSKAEAVALAGCDFLVVGPKVLAALSAATTLEGFNDGLSAAAGTPAPSVAPRLTPAFAAAYEFAPGEAAPPADEAEFNERLGPAGRDLLAEGVSRLVDDANRLEPFFLALSSGQE